MSAHRTVVTTGPIRGRITRAGFVLPSDSGPSAQGRPYRDAAIFLYEGLLHDRRAAFQCVPPAKRAEAVSDAECMAAVVQHAGHEAALRIAGEHAFASWDPARGRLTCARDIFGVRPLHFAQVDDGLAFGSTLRDVLDQLPRKPSPDETRLADFLVDPMELSSTSRTCYEGIRRLPPGHVLTWEDGRLAITRYWDPQPECTLEPDDDVGFEEGFRERLAEAVRCRTEGAGRVGVMLSGGIDSGAVAGMARNQRAGVPLPTVSLLSDDETRCCEAPFVRALRDQGGLEATVLHLAELQPHAQRFKRFMAEADDPFVFFVANVVHTAFQAGADHGLDALLTGIDGDLLCGNSGAAVQDLLRSGQVLEVARLAQATGRGAGLGRARALWTYGLRPWLGLAMPSRLRHRRHVRRRGADADEALRASMIQPELAERAQIRERYLELHAQLWSHTWASSPERHAEFLMGSMLPNALERYTRAAAFAGVETSHPLLDRRLVEFCLGLPARQRGLHGYGKSILRRSMRGLVPDITVERRDFADLGGAVTVQFTRLLFDELEETLRGAKSELEPYLRHELVVEALTRFSRDSDTAAAFRLWKAFTLLSWLRRNG